MSRSRRKPYINICCIGRGSMKAWKRQCNSSTRQRGVEEDIRDWKKRTDRWSAPDDGKRYWNDPKERRK